MYSEHFVEKAEETSDPEIQLSNEVYVVSIAGLFECGGTYVKGIFNSLEKAENFLLQLPREVEMFTSTGPWIKKDPKRWNYGDHDFLVYYMSEGSFPPFSGPIEGSMEAYIEKFELQS